MNSNQLTQSQSIRQTPGKTGASRSQAGNSVMSPTYRGDYSQTRNLPSTNPVRGPSPDPMPRNERIASTQAPNGIKFNTKRVTSTSPQRDGSVDHDDLTNQFNKILRERDEQIEILKQQLQQEVVKRAPTKPQEQGQYDVQQLLVELERLGNELQKSKQNEIRLTSIIQNYENQIHQLTDSNLQLSQQLKEVGSQNQYLLTQAQQIQDSKPKESQSQNNQDIARLQSQLRELEYNNQNYLIQNQALSQSNQDLQLQYDNLNNQIRILKQDTTQSQGTQNQLALILQEQSKEIQDLKNKLTQAQSSVHEAQSKVVNTNTLQIPSDYAQLKESAAQLPVALEKIRSYEKQISLLQEELNLKTQQSNAKDSEISQLNHLLEQASNQNNTQAEYELQQLHSHLVGLQELVQQKDATISDLQKQIAYLESEEAQQQQGNQSNTLQLQSIIEQLRLQNQNLSNQNNEQSHLIEQLRRQSQQSGNSTLDQQRQIEKLLQQINEKDNHIKILGEERDSLRRQLLETDGQRFKIREFEQREAFLNEQIKKLNAEIESQRVNALHQSSVFNDINTYQIRIKELENQGEHLKAEVHRLQGVIQIQNHDLEILRRESERMSTVDAEKQKLTGKVNLLVSEVGRLTKTIQEKQDEIKALNLVILDKDRNLSRIPALEERNQSLSNENSRLVSQIRILNDETIRKLQDENYQLQSKLAQNSNFESIQNELNVKITQINQENQRLNLIIQTLTQEKQKLQSQINESSSSQWTIQDLQSRLELLTKERQKQDAIFQQLNNENNQLKIKLGSLSEIDRIKQENERTVSSLNSEINRLNNALNSKNDEFSRLSIKFQEVSSSSYLVQDLQSRLALFGQDKEKLEDQLRQVSQEKNSLQTRITSQSNAEQGKIQLESQVRLLFEEIDKLKAIIRQKDEEINTYRNFKLSFESQEGKLTSALLKVTLLSAELERLQNDNRDRQNSLVLIDRERQQWNTQKSEYESNINYLRQEISKLNSLIQDSENVKKATRDNQNKVADLEAQLNLLRIELDNVKRDKQGLLSQVSSLQVTINQQNQKINDHSLEYQVQNLSSQLDKAKQENAILLRQVQDLNVTVNQLNIRVSDNSQAEKQLLIQKQTIEKLSGDNQNYQRQVQELYVQLNDLNGKLNDHTLEYQVSSLTQQLQQKQIELENNGREITRLNSSIQSITQELTKLRSESAYVSISQKNQETQINDLNRQIQYFQSEVSRLGQINSDLSTKLSSSSTLEQKNLRLQEQLAQADSLSQGLNLRISELQSRLVEFEDLRNKSIRYSQEQQRLQDKVKELESRLSDLYGTLSQKDKEILNLQSQNSQVSQLNQRVQQYELTISSLRAQHEKDFENQKNQSEYQRKQLVAQEVSEITNKLNLRISSLESDLNRVTTLKNSLENEIRTLHQQNQDLSVRFNQAQERLLAAEERLRQSQYEAQESIKRVKVGQQQTTDLQQNLVQLATEVERYKQLYEETNARIIESDHQKSILGVEIERLNNILKEKLLVIEEYQNREQQWREGEQSRYEIQNIRQQLEDSKKTIEQLIIQIRERDVRLAGFAEIESKVQLFNSQVQSLQYNLDQKDKERQSLISKHESEVNILNSRIQELNSQLVKLNQQSAGFSNLQVNIDQLSREKQNFQSLLQALQEKNSSLSSDILGRDRRISELQQAIQQLQSELNYVKTLHEQEKEDLRIKKTRKEQENENFVQRIEALNQTISNLHSDINQKDIKIREFSSVEQTINFLKQEKEQFLRERDALTQQLLTIRGERDAALQKVVLLSAQLEADVNSLKNLNQQNQINIQSIQQRDKQYSELLVIHRESEYKHNKEAENQRRESQYSTQKAQQEKFVLQEEINRLKSEFSIVEHQYQLKLEDVKRQQDLKLTEELRKQLSSAKVEYERRLNEALNNQNASYQDDLVKRQKAHQGELSNIKNSIESTLRVQIEQQSREQLFKIEQEKKSLQEQINVLQSRNNYLESQLKSLQLQLTQALNQEQDTQKWKDIVEKLEVQRQRDIAEFRHILEEQKNLNVDSSNQLQEAERVAYTTQINQLNQRIQELMESQKLKDQENTSLRGGNANLIRENSQIKMQLSVSNTNTQFQLEIENLKRQIIQANDGKIEQETQIKRLQTQLSQYEIQIQSLSQELSRSNEQLNQRKAERDLAFSQIDQLTHQAANLSHAFSSAGGDADIYKSKFQVLQKEIEELTGQRNMYKEQSERKSDELNRKNLQLVEKIGLLDQLKLQYQANNNKIYVLESKLLDKLQTEEVHIM